MAVTAKESPGKGWRVASEVAELFGVSVQGFHQTWRPLIPSAAFKQVGRFTWINVRQAHDAFVAERVRRELEARNIDSDMAGGGDSPALEEYRKHKARQERIKADAAEKLVAPIPELKQALALYNSAIRRGYEEVQRKYGNDAAALGLEPLAQLEANLGRLIPDPPQRPGVHVGDPFAPGGGTTEGADSGGEAAAAADDEGVRGAGDHPADGKVRRATVRRGKKPVRRAAARPH